MGAEVLEIDALLAMPDAIDVDVLLLPRELKDGVGFYDDSAITLAKEFRAEGASADYQQGPDSREWIGEKHLSPIEVDFLVGIASNAGWAALYAVLRIRHSAKRVRVRIVRRIKRGDERIWEWIKVEGSGEDVAEALRALDDSEGKPAELEDGQEQRGPELPSP